MQNSKLINKKPPEPNAKLKKKIKKLVLLIDFINLAKFAAYIF